MYVTCAEAGLDPEYVLDRASMMELDLYIKGYRRRQYNDLHNTQTIAYTNLLPYSTDNTLTPDKVLNLKPLRENLFGKDKEQDDRKDYEKDTVELEKHMRIVADKYRNLK